LSVNQIGHTHFVLPKLALDSLHSIHVLDKLSIGGRSFLTFDLQWLRDLVQYVVIVGLLLDSIIYVPLNVRISSWLEWVEGLLHVIRQLRLSVSVVCIFVVIQLEKGFLSFSEFIIVITVREESSWNFERWLGVSLVQGIFDLSFFIGLLLESVAVLSTVMEVVFNFVSYLSIRSEGRRVSIFSISVNFRSAISVPKLHGRSLIERGQP